MDLKRLGEQRGGHRRGQTFAPWMVRACATAFFAIAAGVLSAGAQATGSLTAGASSQAAQQPASTNANAPTATPKAATSSSPMTPAGTPGSAQNEPDVTNTLPALATSIWSKRGEQVVAVRFDGVVFDPKDPTLVRLQQAEGKPLDPQKVRDDLRMLFATGRYRNIAVYGETNGNGLTLVYTGVPRYYVGRVEIEGVNSERLASLLEFATKLDPGTPYTEKAIPAAIDGVKQSLAQNGYFAPTVNVDQLKDDSGHQVNVIFHVKTGPRAIVGKVYLEGKDPGITTLQFRRKGDLDCGRIATFLDRMIRRECDVKIARDTTSTALSGARTFYQKKDRLEGTASLQKQNYRPVQKQLDYTFGVDQGPIVHVDINGVKVAKARKKLLIPIYQESAVDNDLLNEGAFNLRDYLQQQGYFDVQDSVKLVGEGTGTVNVEYTVVPGKKHKVVSLTVKGNKYFDTDTLEAGLRVKKADLFVKSGTYSAQLVKADTANIETIYRANGFTKVKVTSSVQDIDKAPNGQPLKEAQIKVTYTIDEGTQQTFGTVALEGVHPQREQTVRALTSTESGQPFSLTTLSNDRDAILSYYLSNGYDHATVEIKQTVETADPSKTDVALGVSEGEQVAIDHVLLSGVVRTKPKVVESQMLVHAGDPLDQGALLQTQRNLYNLALFNEVNAAVQNPTGDALRKNVLVQVTEAKRWDVTYGFGFEAQTGTPARIPGQQLQAGATGTAAQNGKAGVSPRVSVDVSRINLRGTQQSLTLHTSFGLLERLATLSFTNPNLLGKPNLTAQISGGYSNVQNITTFQAQTLQGDFRVSQKVGKADNFIYDFQYRRITVDQNSLEISPNLIPQLSEPVQVGGPGLTYFHDTRDPTPLDATRGQYFSFQEFVSDTKFGSTLNFNRLDVSQATYYTWGTKHKYTFARNLRVGFENVFGSTAGANEVLGITNCQGALLTTNASCNPIALPERMYAGGASSHRGFGINDAGPRDLTTGYPVGGSGVVVNTFELRLPPPTLPVVGDSVSFVIFHDMGNVFRYPGDMFKSIKNFHQPDESTCRNVSLPAGVTDPSVVTGTCNFNYYSHAIGLGARYKTPVGPIRVDFSYNLNPPIYPVFNDYTGHAPYVGQAGHFQFFFSIGQAF